MTPSNNEEPAFRYSEFVTTSHKKRRRQKPFEQSQLPSAALQRVLTEFNTDDSAWFAKTECLLLDALSASKITSPHIICLGLGSPSSSRDAIAQLAFLLQVCQCLTISLSNVSLYDPVFTEADKAILAEHGLEVLSENKNGNYPVEGPTLFYMPHCDMSLYENILRANWTRERLSNIVFVANSFSDYIQNKPRRQLQENAPCLLEIAPFLICHTIPASTSRPTAFNNTSVQFVSPDSDPDWPTELTKVAVLSGAAAA